MPPLSLLIKPASGNCNMRCQYCFYADVKANRSLPSFGMMTLETLEVIVRKALSQAEGSCTFAFQGGEPTLAGLDFYRALMDYQKKYARPGVSVANAIQTNGLVVDRAWAEFFAEHHFLVGLSLDAYKDLHDLYRQDAAGKGTFNKILHTIQLFRQHQVEFNILTVVTAPVAANIRKIYGFYKKNHLDYQQYIPCIEPFDATGSIDPSRPFDALGPGENSMSGYTLTPDLYATFLKNLFDLWYNDVTSQRFVYIRYFENLVGMVAGYPPENCGLLGQCTRQLVIEADGGVYPCDFYVLDKWRIGNVLVDSFDEIERNRDASGFIDVSLHVDDACRTCEWRSLCRGGCRRDREPLIDGQLSLNRYCDAYQAFFAHARPRLAQLARTIGR